MALKIKDEINHVGILIKISLAGGFPYGTSLSVFLSSMPKFWM